MKRHANVMKTDTAQRQASAHAGTASAPAGPRLAQQSEQIAQLQSAAPVQLAGGTVHHNPEKKKHLPKGVGKKQNEVSAKALAIKKASTEPLTNKEAKRQAKASSK